MVDHHRTEGFAAAVDVHFAPVHGVQQQYGAAHGEYRIGVAVHQELVLHPDGIGAGVIQSLDSPNA